MNEENKKIDEETKLIRQPDPNICAIRELDPDIIWPNTSTYKNPEQGGSKIIVVGKAGCFSKGTPVLMYNGKIKPVEEVGVGERVMGPDSKPRIVLELCRNRDKMYKIVPAWGDSYTVNLKHKLVLIDKSDKTIEITVEEYLEKDDGWKRNWKIFRTGVQFPQKCLNDTLYNLCIPKISDQILYNSKNVRECALRFLNYYYKNNIPHRNDTLYLLRSLGKNYSIRGENIYELDENLKCNFMVQYEGEGDYYGFTINGDHRFLLGSFDVVRNTGKSTLIKSLLYSKKHIFPVAMAMSGTEDSNGFYSKFIPETFIFNNYDEEQIQKVINRQKIAKKHLENPWCAMILDDVTEDPAVFRRPLQQGLYKNGRHWKLWYILVLQYALDIRPAMRQNVDGVFILKTTTVQNRKVMYDNYASVIPDFDLFCRLLDYFTENYGCLYIHNTAQVNDWRENVYWYKAKPVPDNFKLGCDEFWDFHEQRKNPEYQDPFM